jgi:GT2 family glycosyltransferase
MSILGLVTVLYKSDEVLEDFFRSLHIQGYKEYHLYLVDNSAGPSTENAIVEGMRKYPIAGFTYIDSGGNVGVAAGNNIGIRKALADGCEEILLLNNDILIKQDFLLGKMAELAKKADLVTVKIYYHDTGLVWMAGGHMDHRRALGVHEGMKIVDHPGLNIPGYITYAPTCFLLVKSSVFRQVGMMDEQYFAYYDDTDFVLRCTKAGYKLWYEPTLHLFHKVSSSSGGDSSPFYIYYGNRNKIYFIRKHYKGLHRLWLLCYVFLSRTVFYFRYEKAGKQKLVAALRDGFKMKVSGNS